MPITIGSNISSLQAQRRLGDATRGVTSVLERLSSGLRINRASDDAAGLSIATSLNADSRVFSQGIRNVNDGISLLNVAEGATEQLGEIVTRLRELATQAANGTYAQRQRLALHSEADSLVEEFNRITRSTRFNGLSLLDRTITSLGVQAGYGSSSVLTAGLGSGLRRFMGTGAFASASVTVGQTDPQTVEIADVNGDGKGDLIQGGINSGGVILVSIGNGDGSFDASRSFVANSGQNLRTLTVRDVNKDGMLDIITTSSSGAAVSVLLGCGNGTFRAGVSYASDGTAWGLGVGDINGDGIDDLVVGAASNSSISVFLGNSNGTYQARYTLQGSGNSNGIALVDLNGDSRLDIASTTQGIGDGLDIFIGSGTGSFAPRQSLNIGSDAFGVQVGDFNRDGIIDLATDGGSSGRIAILTGNGDGTFKLSATYPGGVFGRGLRVADMNGDGLDDIITAAEADGDVRLYLGNGDSSFRAPVITSGNTNAPGIAVGDLNGDGVRDIFVADQGSDRASVHLASTYESTTLPYLNLNSRAFALDALSVLDAAMQRITQERGALGTAQSRFVIAANHLSTIRQNYISAESRIMDADVATESAELLRRQILQQAGASILAQANAQPRIALQLLRLD